jgi:hypothetical protein
VTPAERTEAGTSNGVKRKPWKPLMQVACHRRVKRVLRRIDYKSDPEVQALYLGYSHAEKNLCPEELRKFPPGRRRDAYKKGLTIGGYYDTGRR